MKHCGLIWKWGTWKLFWCGLQLEDSKAIFLHGAGSWWCITIPCLVTKDSTILKVSSRQTLTEILDLCCDLGLEHKSIQKIQSFYCMFWHKLLEWPIIKISLVAKILLVQLVSNWILMSYQPHSVTSGQPNSGHKQVYISKLLIFINLSVRSLHKTNHFANIK